MGTTAKLRRETGKLELTASARRDVADLVHNLLNDTGTPALIYLAERHGLPRVPGLGRAALIERILLHLSPAALAELGDELIASRFGDVPTPALLARLRDLSGERMPHTGAPRLDSISAEEATLLESASGRWLFTMRGHDVGVDVAGQTLKCDCAFFTFASKRSALCKHLLTALALIPEAY